MRYHFFPPSLRILGNHTTLSHHLSTLLTISFPHGFIIKSYRFHLLLSSEIGHFLSCSVQASLFLISILLLLLALLISIYPFTVNVFKTLYIENEMTRAFV